MGITDMIAQFIDEVLNETEGSAELRRADIASRFGCVPSQVNYVISTRFSPERGYIVESRRGGGGYIRIRRVRMDPQQLIMHTVNAVGDSLDSRTAAAFVSNALDSGILDRTSARLILAAVSESALRAVPREKRDEVRAGIFKAMFVNLIS